jgi:transcriptional regulator with XRE-family HTH domain
MSSVKVAEIRTRLASAIRQLREALGDTQEGMARRLGCTLSGYIQWEKGRRVPGGDWLLKLMALCPDEETRLLFQEQVPRFPGQPGSSLPRIKKQLRISSTTPEQRRQARAIAREGIEILFKLGQAGYRPADQKLQQFADAVNRVAGDFSHAYRPPK